MLYSEVLMIFFAFFIVSHLKQVHVATIGKGLQNDKWRVKISQKSFTKEHQSKKSKLKQSKTSKSPDLKKFKVLARTKTWQRLIYSADVQGKKLLEWNVFSVQKIQKSLVWFLLFNAISTIMGYLIPKPFL